MAKPVIRKRFTGLAELDRDIDNFVRAVGDDMRSYARRVVPVDTGRLQRSIVNKKVKVNEYLIGSPVDYALYVEEGTRNQSAQPYLKPAAAQLKNFVNKNRKRL